MNNELNEEQFDLKITPKTEQYFKNKLLLTQTNQMKKYPYNIFNISNNINNKYNNLMKENKSFLNSSENNNNNTTFDFYKFNNKLLREAISLNSYNNKDQDEECTKKKKLKIKKKLKLLEKDVDFYSPEYKRLLSAHMFNAQARIFNQGKTYKHLIKKNIKNFLLSHNNENHNKGFKKSLILEKKNISNILIDSDYLKNKKLKNKSFNTLTSVIYDKKKNNKKRSKSSTIFKYNKEYYSNKYRYNLNFLFNNKGNNNKKSDKFKINIVNLSYELDKISKILKEYKK